LAAPQQSEAADTLLAEERNVPTYRQLVAKKLEESSLTAADAKALGIESLSAQATAKLFKKFKVPALRLNYYSTDGKKRRDVYRVRLLEKPVGAFGSIAETAPKYLQPTGSVVSAYFPRIIPWSEIVENTEESIIITEGELKAACACKYGWSTIGLGGCWSWRSSKNGWSLLPELERITWEGRDVVICFDDDAAQKADVAQAIVSLCGALTKRGALPRIAVLPSVRTTGKTGIDDFIVAKGPEAFGEVLDEADGDELTHKLWDFNSRFAVILDPGLVYDQKRHARYNPREFRTTLFANVWAAKREFTADGTPKLKQTQVAPTWVQWPTRRQFSRLTYDPGKGPIVDGALNGWGGWSTEPIKGSVEPWKRLIDLLFEDVPREARHWFECWCAYPIRYPGTKLLSAVGIWSHEQGVGKSLVGVTLSKIYGDNYIAISQRELESDFNSWAVNKQFVMVDDVSSHDSRAKADVLKKIITQRELVVNMKYVPTYVLPDRANYYLTSNRPNAFYVEERDRRFFIHEVTGGRKSTQFYDSYFKWLDTDGARALFHYFKHELNLEGFSPFEPPPSTKAKREMVDSVKTELTLWLTELREMPEEKLKLGSQTLTRDLYTPRELTEIFGQTCKGRPVAPNVMGLHLREYFEPVGVLRSGESTGRYYAVRNGERWKKATKVQLTKHLKDSLAVDGGGKY